jgi:hypothetical protein
VILAAVALATATAPTGWPDGKCIDVRDPELVLGFGGRLGEARFESPSASAPPQGEHAFILQLDGPICIDDGGDFADPAERFDRVHLWGTPQVTAELRAAMGRRIEVHGRGYASHNGHHHAPLVMQVERIVVFEGSPDE